MKSTPFIIITTTSDNESELREICNQLVEQRLAACCQISGPQASIYLWQGQIETAIEWRCEIKTRREHYSRIESLMRELHHYEVPEIIATEISDGSVDYLNWLMTETEPQTGSAHSNPHPSSSISPATPDSSNTL